MIVVDDTSDNALSLQAPSRLPTSSAASLACGSTLRTDVGKGPPLR